MSNFMDLEISDIWSKSHLSKIVSGFNGVHERPYRRINF